MDSVPVCILFPLELESSLIRVKCSEVEESFLKNYNARIISTDFEGAYRGDVSVDPDLKKGYSGKH